jgi:deoxyribonuclease V
MNLITDVHYHQSGAQSAGILFQWGDEKPIQEFVVPIHKVNEYEPGKFYKRELPCLMSLLEHVPKEEIKCIIIDGFVFLDDAFKPGLGKYLYDAINQITPVIGIAKSGYYGNTKNVREVTRGISQNPLFVSCVGIDLDQAFVLVRDMKGPNRLPTMVTLVDQLSRKQL